MYFDIPDTKLEEVSSDIQSTIQHNVSVHGGVEDEDDLEDVDGGYEEVGVLPLGFLRLLTKFVLLPMTSSGISISSGRIGFITVGTVVIDLES